MAKPIRIFRGARLAVRCGEWRIYRDPNKVRAGRNRRLAVAAVQNEVLATQLPDISVRPTYANPLVAGNRRARSLRRRAT